MAFPLAVPAIASTLGSAGGSALGASALSSVLPGLLQNLNLEFGNEDFNVSFNDPRTRLLRSLLQGRGDQKNPLLVTGTSDPIRKLGGLISVGGGFGGRF